MIDVPHIIRKKRDGHPLDRGEMRSLLLAHVRGEIPDYQMAAFLMAVFFRSMSEEELDAWTEVMLNSGTVIDLRDVPGPKVDKHSTGGVGDKVSLVLAPLAAACGVKVPMISGRGLGHTGGTLDKLESIPGMSVRIDVDRYRRILREAGLVFAGQTDDLCPADRKLYALRDVTGTVESIPLIASSIMSKKLAEGIDALVLDVKVGDGAFMRTIDDARKLARTMVRIGSGQGKKVKAVITAMDEPLGRAAGNAPEVVESVETLRNGGPPDLRAIVIRLTSWMLVLGGVQPDLGSAGAACEQALASGAALARFLKVVEMQGGDPRAIEDTSLMPSGRHRREILAPSGGFVARVDAMSMGRACVMLGAGRLRSEDAVDPGAGMIFAVRRGDRVSSGDLLVTLMASDASRIGEAERIAREGFAISREPPSKAGPLIIEEV